MSETKPNRDSIINEFSSKIKDIYIELHNFSFFHAPTDISNDDNRFVGRKKIIDRLKHILTNSESKTGAYLVTGHRGIGKSSFVNKTISEISSSEKPPYLFRRLASTFFLIIIYSFLQFYFKIYINTNLSVSVFILLVILLGYALLTYYFFEDKTKSRKIEENKYFQTDFIKKLFIYEHSNKPWYRFRIILKDIYIFIFIILICNILHYFIQKKYAYNISFFRYYLIAFVIVIIINIIKIISDKYEKNLFQIEKKYGWKFFKNFIYSLFPLVFKYPSNIYIKINFGYDNLKEIDILRLVARNLKTKYEEAINLTRKNFLGLLVYPFLIYLFTSWVYYNQNVYKTNLRIKKTINIYQLFPSQDINCLEVKSYSNSISYNDYILKKISKIENNKYYIKSCIANIDYFINLSYIKARNILVSQFFSVFSPIIQFETIANKSIGKFTLLPYHLDYFFFLYFFSILLLISLIKRIVFLNINSHYSILKKINRLNDLIVSEVSTGNEGRVNTEKGIFKFAYSRYRSQRYPIADVREIEKHLLEILDNINKLAIYIFKPRIIFIFDELDKIEPQSKVIIGEKEEEEGTVIGQHSPSFSPEGTRQRQYAIQTLLANLKYFLTTAKAKFIFIAGREMFDASLADISDRNFFIGSIFHDVIYVDSFLSDSTDDKLSDVTSLTERYICYFLLPDKYVSKYTKINKSNTSIYTLKTYNQYLLEKFEELNDEKNFNDNNNKSNESITKIIAKQKREKIISVLQQFIIYLTHTSNGAPKKITTFFEKHVETHDNLDLNRNLVINNYLAINTFLVLDYKTQYKIGMINYLASPIILSITNSIKYFGDKLLVSTSFLVDHLFKFHRYGFSWRNLEYAPEVLETNKTPELRNFITNIIQNLTQTHLQELFSGIFDFKFNKRISFEVAFLSKISEEASATFNFTLDESQAIKQYYNRLLKRLELRYKNVYADQKRDELIHSIASVHIILGDLYFYDEEYNDAIIEYMDSIQYVKNMNPKDESMKLGQIILLVRNMLKLGLAYEKRKTYDSAFYTYGEITNMLISFRDIDLEKFGLEERKSEDEILLVKKEKYRKESDDENSKYDEKFYNETEPRNLSYNSIYCEKEKFVDKLTENLTPLKENILFKISAFEGLRVIYQSLLAKLQIIEKSHLGGITQVDITRVEKEFEYLQKVFSENEKFLISSEFWNKMADILYYKNGLFFDNSKTNIHYHCIKFANNRPNPKNECKIPCSSCEYYYRSLKILLKNCIRYEFRVNDKIEIIKILDALRYKKFLIFSNAFYKTIASLLSDLGDVYLSCSDESSMIDSEFFNNFIGFVKNEDGKGYEIIINYYNGRTEIKILEQVLLYYYTSAIFYKKANEYKLYSWQLTKILYFFNEYISILQEPPYRNNQISGIIFELEEHIVRKAISGLYNAYENISNYEIEKQRNIYNKEGIYIDNYKKIKNKHISLNRLSINSDIEEINIVYADLMLTSLRKTSQVIFWENLKYYYKENLISPYILNDNMYNRILRLNFKAKLNFYIFTLFNIPEFNYYKEVDLDHKKAEKVFNNIITKTIINNKIYDFELGEAMGNKKNYYLFSDFADKVNFGRLDYKEIIEFLIVDSIYCLLETIKIISTYGKSYVISHSFVATVHEKLMYWCDFYKKYVNLFDNDKKLIKDIITGDSVNNLSTNIKKQLAEKIGEENLNFVSTHYHIEQAKLRYYSATETHTEGRAYKNFIENMFFLNDDFNDKIFHFSAATERFRINTGVVRKKVISLKECMRNTTIYNHDNYMITQID